jgi:hypothetical protein
MDYDKQYDYDKNLVQHDLSIWITVIIVSNIVHCIFKNNDPFDIDWLYYSIASLFGLTIHSLFTSKITLIIIKRLNITKYNVKLALADLIKWSTVFIFNNILFSYLKYKQVTFNNDWFKLYGGIILGYVIFDLLMEKEVYNLSVQNQSFSVNAFKSAIGIFIGYFISYGSVHIDFFHMFASIEIALIIYYVLVKKFIPSLLL